MRNETQSKLHAILGYRFFGMVGKSLPDTVTMVRSWSAAARMCRSAKWEACQLMARNALQRFVEKKSWERSQTWNPVVDELRESLSPFVGKLQFAGCSPEKELKRLRASVSWDLMFICLEAEFSDLVEPFFYNPMLDKWYAAGHFPCGWDGDEFSDGWDGLVRGGQLMVF